MTEYKKVFLDTTPIIYFLDQDINFGAMTQELLSIFLDNDSKLMTSSITCTEYLTYPYRTNNTEKIAAFLNSSRIVRFLYIQLILKLQRKQQKSELNIKTLKLWIVFRLPQPAGWVVICF